MAVTEVTEEGEERTADQDEKSIRAVRIFTVTFDGADNPVKEPLMARNASDGTTTIPKKHQVHPYNNWLFVKNKHVDTIGPHVNKVTVYYESFTDPWTDPDVSPAPISPLLQPPEVSWYFASSIEPIDRDIYGNPIATSAGEPFDPPITKPFDDLVLRVVRNEPEFNALQASAYKNALNSDIFLLFAPGKVKCIVYLGTKQYAASLVYWKVIYEFQIRWDGWARRIKDEGYRALNEAGDAYEEIVDDNGMKISQPWPLDGAGKKLTTAQIKAGTAYWLTFDVDWQKPFSVLGL